MKMSNRWNRFIYRAWAPVYDRGMERMFGPGRRRAMEALALRAGERACFVGMGTGADLTYVVPGVEISGIDLSAPMLEKARQKAAAAGQAADLRIGDAQALPFGDGEFDAVVLNLILSVVPDPARCLGEALRVLGPGGRIVIFDKFLPDGGRPTARRRIMNAFTTLFGTDINRRFDVIRAGLPCKVEMDEPSILDGMYRVIMLRTH